MIFYWNHKKSDKTEDEIYVIVLFICFTRLLVFLCMNNLSGTLSSGKRIIWSRCIRNTSQDVHEHSDSESVLFLDLENNDGIK